MKYSQRIITFYFLVFVSIFILWVSLFWRQLIYKNVYNSQQKTQSLRSIILNGTRGTIYDRNGYILAADRPRYSAVVYLNELRSEFRNEFKLLNNSRNQNISKDLKKNSQNFKNDLQSLKNNSEKQDKSLNLQKQARINVLQRHLDVLNNLISKKITIDSETIEKHFREKLLLPMPLATDISDEEYGRLIMHLPQKSPIQVYIDNIRYYPFGSSACHAIGYVVNSKNSADCHFFEDNLTAFYTGRTIGKIGLEAKFDDFLSGKPGKEVWLVDPTGVQFEQILRISAKKGSDIHSSLDINLQMACENAIEDYSGAIIVMKIKTGEVLSMVSRPDFDSNDFNPSISKDDFQEITESGAWINRCIQGLYPPASPFKLIETVAMLEKGIINENSSVDCSGGWQIGERIFHCHKLTGHGLISLSEAIGSSCNPFYIKYGLISGPSVLCEQAKMFNFDKQTGIELPFESNKMISPDPKWKQKSGFGKWTDGDTANLAMGQGFFRITPMQMACFISAFANKQKTICPTLLKSGNFQSFDQIHKNKKPENLETQTENLKTQTESLKTQNDFSAKERKYSDAKDAFLAEKSDISKTILAKNNKIDDKIYDLIVNGMRESVEIGTSRLAKNKYINLAGKTGTGQISQGNKKFKNIAWFVGFFPIENPEFSLTVLIEDSYNNQHLSGGLTAAPIAQKIINYFADNFINLSKK